ncbi:hypothetical protein P3W85_16105 [Cupriavidus basilensis]|uniref:Uncharacterized protein n=1 Tax=Cupriavidus basilensis TaxID=68895 RepID=A0ABT6APB8_9BURK|nr:hypothetical protein [Cupriavidus basilensis]MDF3834465.1 hypothetical protein [Cupriavidus basilensis]
MAIGGQTAGRVARIAKAMGLAPSGDVPAAWQQGGWYEKKNAYSDANPVTALSTSCKPIHFVTAIPKSFPHNALTQSDFVKGALSPETERESAVEESQRNHFPPRFTGSQALPAVGVPG